MHRVNLLTLIAEHLSWRDLLSFSLLNRTCYQVAQCEDLWKRECLGVWTSSSEFYGEVILGKIPLEKTGLRCRWKLLMKKGVAALALWRKLANTEIVSEEDVTLIGNACFDMLREPVPQSPTLRRESRAFSTTLQDFLAYSTLDPPSFPDDPQLSFFFDSLQSCEYQLMNELDSVADLEMLAVARWHVVGAEAGSATSTAASSLTSSDIVGEVQSPFEDVSERFLTFRPNKLRKSPATLLKLYYALKKMFSFFCKLHLRLLHESRDGLQLLSCYVQLWNSFSSSAVSVNTLFAPFSKLLSEVYSEKWMNSEIAPEFSIVRMMVLTWRRKVFVPLQTSLFEAVAVLLEAQRRAAQTQAAKGVRRVTYDDKEMIVLMSAVSAMADLSVHEGNVHFSEHSKFQTDGPYTKIHNLIIEGSQSLISTLPLSFSAACSIFQSDLKLIRRFALPCTIRPVQRLYAEAELALYTTHFVSTYTSQCWPLTTRLLGDPSAQSFVNSEFGALLFRRVADRTRVERFVEYLLAVDRENEDRMRRWLDLVRSKQEEEVTAETSWSVRDEEIEYQVRHLSPHIPPNVRESPFFPLSRDLTSSDLGQLICMRDAMQLCD